MAQVCLITPTGARPEGMALLARYLSEQTYTGPMRWVVVDDCNPMTPLPEVPDHISVEVLRPFWRWQPGMNTQAQSMDRALNQVPDNAAVLIIEDDDAYLPQHIATMLEALEDAELVGEKTSRYYNVRTGRWQLMKGQRQAALAATACRGSALALLRDLCATGAPQIDMHLWGNFEGVKTLLDTDHVVGIKGLPGREGIGVGHRANFGRPDTDGKLIEWLGEKRAEAYQPYRRPHGE